MHCRCRESLGEQHGEQRARCVPLRAGDGTGGLCLMLKQPLAHPNPHTAPPTVTLRWGMLQCFPLGAHSETGELLGQVGTEEHR